MTCRFRPTSHAKDRMIERGIARDEAVDALMKGAKMKRGHKILTRYRGIEVVYVQKPCNYQVITLYRR